MPHNEPTIRQIKCPPIMLLALAVTLLGIAKIIKIEDAMEATITKFWKLRDINIMDRLNPARRLCKMYGIQSSGYSGYVSSVTIPLNTRLNKTA